MNYVVTVFLSGFILPIVIDALHAHEDVTNHLTAVAVEGINRDRSKRNSLVYNNEEKRFEQLLSRTHTKRPDHSSLPKCLLSNANDVAFMTYDTTCSFTLTPSEYCCSVYAEQACMDPSVPLRTSVTIVRDRISGLDGAANPFLYDKCMLENCSSSCSAGESNAIQCRQCAALCQRSCLANLSLLCMRRVCGQNLVSMAEGAISTRKLSNVDDPSHDWVEGQVRKKLALSEAEVVDIEKHEVFDAVLDMLEPTASVPLCRDSQLISADRSAGVFVDETGRTYSEALLKCTQNTLSPDKLVALVSDPTQLKSDEDCSKIAQCERNHQALAEERARAHLNIMKSLWNSEANPVKNSEDKMGCFVSKSMKSTGVTEQRRYQDAQSPGEFEDATMKNITEKIVSDDRNISTARIIRNATVYERYDILFYKVLGTGISGEVMEAVSRTTGDHVAIKTLSTVNLTKKKSEMLYNEIEVYLKLDHPNICKLLEVYEDESAVHLVMELCSGGELYERLAQLKRYTERDAARVTLQMLNAINYCHAHSICHRDIKLENWVYANPSSDSQLKLIDWGMSRIFTGEPMTQIHGTVYYVSPQVLAGNYDNKCDVWSIGVIVYMILSGSPPFPGQNDQEIINRIKSTEVSFDGPRWLGISKDAKDYISLLLTREPKMRPSAAQAMDHPWLRRMISEEDGCSVDNEIDLDVLRNIQQFSRQNAIRRAALGMIAMSLTQNDVANMEEEFMKLDSNRGGTIKLDELANALTTRLNMSNEEATQIFNRVDQTGDDEIHYTEFLAAALQTKLVVNEKYIKAAFQKFDVDNTGLISEDDLRRVMGDVYKGEDVGEIFRQADYKNNGFIDYEEFLKAIMDSSCVEPYESDLKSDKTTTTMRLVRNRLLQLSDDNVAVLKERYGPATFTWGSCRRDARFKMDMASLEKLHDLHIRDAISEHDAESDRDIENVGHEESKTQQTL